MELSFTHQPRLRLREVHNIVILVGCVCDFRWIDLNCTGESKATVEYWDYDITVAEKNKEITAIYNAQKVYISTIEIEWEE